MKFGVLLGSVIFISIASFYSEGFFRAIVALFLGMLVLSRIEEMIYEIEGYDDDDEEEGDDR
jgi:hypothetical protein